MRVYFVRHCEAVSNVQQILAGQMEFPLTEQGLQQAQLIAENFYKKIQHIDSIYVSSQLRTRQTAQPFAHLFNVQPISDERLKEQDWGKFCGKTYQELRSDPQFHHPKTQDWSFKPEGGEGYADVYQRVMDFFSTLQQLPSQSSVLCVTHGGTMRIIRGILEQTAPHSYSPDVPSNGEIWHIESFQPGRKHHIDIWHFGPQIQHPM